MTFDFQSLGIDRLAQNIARSVNKPTGTLVTGDITRGEVVEVSFSASSEETATTKTRRVGAIPLYAFFDNSNRDMQWKTEDETLTVRLSSSATGTAKFWVF